MSLITDYQEKWRIVVNKGVDVGGESDLAVFRLGTHAFGWGAIAIYGDGAQCFFFSFHLNRKEEEGASPLLCQQGGFNVNICM